MPRQKNANTIIIKTALMLILILALTRPHAIFASAVNQTTDVEAVRDQILDGVSKLANPTQPGKMVVFGEAAYSIANYKDQDHREPMLAAADWGQGKVLAMGDHQWLNMDAYGNVDDTGTLYLNSIAWLAGTTDKSIKIVVTPHTSAQSWLETQGFTNVVQSGNYTTELADADLLIGWLGSSVAQSDLDTISSFVTNGGGLFMVEYGIGYSWWWGTDLPDAPGNKLLRAVGIGFSNDWPNGTLELTRATGQTTAQNILAMLDDPSAFTATELDIGGAVLTRIYQVLPDNDPLLAQLDTAYLQRIAQINPTPLTPITNSFDKALLTREARLLVAQSPQDVTIHRLAEILYGAVPVTAPRVTQTVSIDTSKSRWQPTGLFAAPGEVVTITVPAVFVNQGYNVRINAHSDDISPRNQWERPPVVHRSFPIEQATTTAANGFGGLIFIDVGSTPPDIGTVDIQIENAVEAPYFVLGQHTDQEWIDTLRQRPAPFGLFVADNMIIALPTHQIESANLAEPTALMNWWNRTVFLQDELADQTQFRTSPELANVDVQISAGAAHAGYPYQAYEKHWGNMADWDHLQNNGSWGDFHELGHNHQRGWWTFDGDGEVSVNIFSNYALETLAPNATGGWSWSADRVQVIERAINDVSGGGTYASKSDRWSFWFQLADGFGWDAYRQVFRQYEALNANNPSALPTTDQQEKDQWLVRFSNHVGYDMSCFMVDIWGLQVTQTARDAVNQLPCWRPVIGGHLDAVVPTDGSHTFDIAGNARSMDSVADVVAVGPIDQGTIIDNEDGTWTFTPPFGYAGDVTIPYTLQSSVGNRQAFSITATVTNPNSLMLGDANCDRAINVIDALYIMQYGIDMRSDNNDCPLANPLTQIYTRAGDVNANGTSDVIDALFIMQCEVEIANPYCSAMAGNGAQNAITVAETIDGTANLVEIDSIKHGETISLQLNTNEQNVAAGTFEVTYDSRRAQVSECNVASGGLCNTTTPGLVRISFVNPEGLRGTHSVAELTFENSAASITGIRVAALTSSAARTLAYEIASIPSDQSFIFVPFMKH